MKKYLAILCTLLMLTSFASCGDNQESSSEPSESILEVTTEELTTEPETTTIKTTTVKTTTKVTTTKTTASATKTEIKNKKFTFEDLSFELPENCEEDKETDHVSYRFEDLSFISIIKSPGASQFDLYNSDNSLKQLTFEVMLSSIMENSSAEKIGESEKTSVDGEFALKQKAQMYGFADVVFYAFVYGDNMYTIGFTTMGEGNTQAYDIQDEVIKSISLNEDTKTKNEKTTESSTIKIFNSFEPFTISGSGSTVIRDVNIPAEFIVYNATHNGEHNFIARFYDCNDGRESLVNEIGNYSCTQIFDATDIDDSSPGMVEVDADGDWSITFSPVRAVVSNETSTSFSGYGADITGAFKSTGNMVCTVSHDGSSNFIVHAYELTENGDREPVANEIGEYNGQCVIRTKKDTLYFFAVDADGNWTIDVE